MRISFAYAPIPMPRGETAYRPMLGLELIVPNGAYFDTVALVDSGADACLFGLKMARFLKLDPAKMRRALTAGVGSSANVTYYTDLTIKFGDGLHFQTQVGFTQGMDHNGFGLLGQLGFFENFNVEFRHRERLFTMEPS